MEEKYSQHEFAKQCIYNALMSLMEGKELEELTITEITRRAGVSRMAYYRNFESKEDILRSYVDDLFLSYVNTLRANGDFSFESFILTALGIFRKHHTLMGEIKKEKLESMLVSQFEGYLEMLSSVIFREAYSDSEYLKYYSSFLAGGIANLILRWVGEGMPQSDAQMERMIIDFVNLEAVLNLSQNQDQSQRCFQGNLHTCNVSI